LDRTGELFTFYFWSFHNTNTNVCRNHLPESPPETDSGAGSASSPSSGSEHSPYTPEYTMAYNAQAAAAVQVFIIIYLLFTIYSRQCKVAVLFIHQLVADTTPFSVDLVV
jgi:hypothetical protein